MSEFFRVVFASVLFFYAVVCMVVVPLIAWSNYAEERACAEQYQVYECAKAEEWKPKEARHD